MPTLKGKFAGLAPIAALCAKGPRSTTPPDDNMIESKKLVITMYEWEVAILRGNINAYALWCALQSWFGHVPEPMTFSPSALVEADMIHGWDEQRYRRALKWLVDAHMLKVLNQGGGKGNRSVYCFDKPSEEAIERAVDQFRHARRRKEIPRSDGRGLMQLHPGEAAG